MAGIFDALKIIREQLPKFTQEMGVPFLGKDKPTSVMDKVNPNAEKHALESIMEAATMLPGAGIVGKAALRSPRLASAGAAAATGDPTALLMNPILALGTSSNNAEAAFVTPRPGATNLRKFLDVPTGLEHLPNPKNLDFTNIDSTFLHTLYNQSPEGRAILKAVPNLPNAKVIHGDTLPPTHRGKVSGNERDGYTIEINAFPASGVYEPDKVVHHETQHLIDEVQKRVSGTNLLDVKKYKNGLKSDDIQKNMDSEGTVDAKTLQDIMSQKEVDVYRRHTGENRARRDAESGPVYAEEYTWFEDVLTGKPVFGSQN
jgi:hypothetical protein